MSFEIDRPSTKPSQSQAADDAQAALQLEVLSGMPNPYWTDLKPLQGAWNVSKNIAIGAAEQLRNDFVAHPFKATGEVAVRAAAVVAAVAAAPEVGALAGAGAACVGLEAVATTVAGAAQAAWLSLPFARTSTSAYRDLAEAYKDKATQKSIDVLFSPEGRSKEEIAQAENNVRDQYGTGALEALLTTVGVAVVASGFGSFGTKGVPKAEQANTDAPPAQAEPATSQGVRMEGRNLHSASRTRDQTEHLPHLTIVEGGLPDWSQGPDAFGFAARVMRDLPKSRNERALAAIARIQQPGYTEALLKSRVALRATILDKLGFSQETMKIMGHIDDPDFMARAVQEHAELAEPYKAYVSAAGPKGEALRAIEPTRQALEASINSINAEHGLPPVRLSASIDMEAGTDGAYKDGTITLPISDFAGAHPKLDLANLLRHEDEHHIQLCLHIAGCIEKIAGNEPRDPNLKAVESALDKEHAVASPELIRAVDQARTDNTGKRIPFSEEEKLRLEAITRSIAAKDAQVMAKADLAQTEDSLRSLGDEHGVRNTLRAFAQHCVSVGDTSGPPAFIKEFLGENTVKNWPHLPDEFPWPSGETQGAAFKQAFEDFLRARQKELEERLGSDAQQYREYRSWHHEREAHEEGEAAGVWAGLVQAFRSMGEGNRADLQTTRAALSDGSFQSDMMQEALASVHGGDLLDGIRQYADAISLNASSATPPDIIKELVGERVAQRWPVLPRNFKLSAAEPDLAVLRQRFVVFLEEEIQKAQGSSPIP